MGRANNSFAAIRAELSWRLFAVAFFGSMASTGFGFDQGWWAGAMSFTEFTSVFGHYSAETDSWALSATQQSVGTGVGILAVVVGLFIGAVLNERLGRWKTFLIQAIVALVGVIIESTSFESYTQLIIGRVVVYIAGGIATNVVPVYQAECAPPTLRGLMTTTYNGALMLGALASALIIYLSRNVKSHWSWRGVIVAQIASPALCFIGLFFVPESPRWLVKQGRTADAAKSLRILRGNDIDAEKEVELLQQLLNKERETKAQSYLECFRGTDLRRTIIVVGTQVLQQALGIPLIANYLGVFLIQIGFTDTLLIVMLTYVIGVAASIVTMFTIDITGRRNILIYPAILLSVLMFIVAGLTRNGAVGLTPAGQKGAVALLLIWFAVFQLTWGSGAWIVTAEIPGSATREKSVAISALSSYAVSCVITFVNPYVMNAIAGKVGFIYGSFSVIAAVFVFFFVPEVKQRSLAAIDELFEEKVPTREFPEYVCQSGASEVSESEFVSGEKGVSNSVDSV
ncbi:hypothetical protein G7Z17_g1802 [Cylindrodendrum hubeiense]|uniref:Major facilitator superfamily (MFS) profile domain-containing protein n=1 Tax=Cylindrodendrum hubeiense TaxID=595255 RepID=A0A9P5HPD5_9HYPO|nr:hypothetical protein G7Z17_g1802 [Cylindrodendrum hubeiense]